MSSPNELLREIANIVKGAVGPGIGFALFLDAGVGGMSYVSNVLRSDVVASLEEWLEKTNGALNAKPAKRERESSESVDTRLVLERKCVEIGETIGAVTQLALFLFNFGEGGNIAYFANMPKETTRLGVSNWVRSVKQPS